MRRRQWARRPWRGGWPTSCLLNARWLLRRPLRLSPATCTPDPLLSESALFLTSPPTARALRARPCSITLSAPPSIASVCCLAASPASLHRPRSLPFLRAALPAVSLTLPPSPSRAVAPRPRNRRPPSLTHPPSLACPFACPPSLVCPPTRHSLLSVAPVPWNSPVEQPVQPPPLETRRIPVCRAPRCAIHHQHLPTLDVASSALDCTPARRPANRRTTQALLRCTRRVIHHVSAAEQWRAGDA